MARQKGFLSHPCSYVRPGGTWPDGPLKPRPPPEVLLARHVSTVLRDYCDARGGLNSHELAAEAGITQRLSYALLHGRSWPSLLTLARVERHLGVALWVNRHHAGHPPVLRLRPNQYLRKGATWPDGPLITRVTPEVRAAQHIAMAFRDSLEAGKGLTIADAAPEAVAAAVAAAAAEAGISEPAAHGLLNGDTWPDLVTIIRVERALGGPLWANQHHAATPIPLLERPNCYVLAGTWPDGALVNKPPKEAVAAQKISIEFRKAYDTRLFGLGRVDAEDPKKKIASAAKELRISVAVIEGLINGSFWPDLATIARLERNLHTRIWPSQVSVPSD